MSTIKPILAALALALLVGSCSWSSAPTPPPLAVEISILDVGQGDAILLSAAGLHWLIDAGPPGSNITRQLQQRGVGQLERLIITHHHLDHFGGAPDLLRKLSIKQLSLSADPETSPAWQQLQQLIDSLALPTDTLWRGDWISLGSPPDTELSLRVLHPVRGLWQGGNSASLVLQLIAPTARALFTGDLEQEGEEALLQLDGERLASELLKVGHHGSRTSSSLPFLAAVQPLQAAISVGANNSYGHPHPEAVADLLLLLGDSSRLHRTDHSGTLHFSIDGWGLRSPNSPNGEGLLRW